MTRIVYLLRSEPERLSPALFAAEPDALVVALEPALPGSVAGRVLSSGDEESVAPGALLSYSDLLTLLDGAEKVMTL